MQFLYLTDLHMRDPANSWVDNERANFFASCLRELAQTYADAEFCVVTGDLTDQAEPMAYSWLYEQFKELPFPTIPLLGNHDDREAFWREFGVHGNNQANFVQSFRRSDNACFIFLDTIKPGSDAGTLCDARLFWLEKILQENRDVPVFLFMHHPPCEIGDVIMDPIKLDNPAELGHLLSNARNVRHIFVGHVHRNITTSWEEIPLTSIPGQSLNTTSTHVDFGLTAGIVEFERDSIQVSQVSFSHRASLKTFL